MTRQSYR